MRKVSICRIKTVGALLGPPDASRCQPAKATERDILVYKMLQGQPGLTVECLAPPGCCCSSDRRWSFVFVRLLGMETIMRGSRVPTVALSLHGEPAFCPCHDLPAQMASVVKFCESLLTPVYPRITTCLKPSKLQRVLPFNV